MIPSKGSWRGQSYCGHHHWLAVQGELSLVGVDMWSSPDLYPVSGL